MQKQIIDLQNITVDFDGFKALNKVNLSMNRGELRVLIGPNGAGKSTVLDVISGKVKPKYGKVVFKDKNICGKSEHRIVRQGISRKFQTPTIFGNLKVYENMELSLRRRKGVFSSMTFKVKSYDKDKIHSVLNLVGLNDKVDIRAGILSHGEKQWLELGMSIIQEPLLLLVDEPVAGMTGKEREMTGQLLQKISQQSSVLVVEHDMEFVRRIAKKVTVLHEGMILCEGTMDEVQNDPIVVKVYLGRGEEG